MSAQAEITARARRILAERLAGQGKWGKGQSPINSHLLLQSAADLDTEGAVWMVLQGFEDEPGTSAIALRFLGAVHRLVLRGRLPELARHYPSVGGDGDAKAAWPHFYRALVEHRDEVRELVKAACQTNEVGRSAALLCGFLQTAHDTGLPLRLLEIGSSAGLNLRWDHYRYEWEGRGWGDPNSPVVMDKSFDAPPPFEWNATVDERIGCDIKPMDVNDPEAALTLRSFIWPDQVDRFRLLDGAIKVAQLVPVTVLHKDAGDFLAEQLTEPRPGLATVVFESVMWQYLTDKTRDRIISIIEGAGVRATSIAPFGWLRMEIGEEAFEVRLRLWPDGSDRLLARTGPHGTNVRWLND